MKTVEEVLLKTWTEMGLVRTKRVSVGTRAQAKNIAYYTDADLCHQIRQKIVNEVKRVRKTVTLRKSFSSFTRTSKRQPLRVKICNEIIQRQEMHPIKTLKKMTHRVVDQAAGIVSTLYARGYNKPGRWFNQLVSLGKKIVYQTEGVHSGQIPHKRLYSMPELDGSIIKRGGSHPACEFGSVASLSLKDDGLFLSHAEYQQNVSDPATMGRLINGISL
ncbi:hypothetical protein N9174_02090 [bacterium]|nr:hypothetical protein [bacterium]